MSSAHWRALWDYREFITGSVRREFQARYRDSLLGATWTVLNPLAMIVVYTVVFSQAIRAHLVGAEDRFGYSIYLCAGVLLWGLFAEILGRSQNVFLDHANLIKKLNFPRLCLPIIIIASALLNFAIIFGLFALFLLLIGKFPGAVFIGLLPVLLLTVGFAASLGMVLGVLNVFFRDVGQLFAVVLQFWFWLTPIVYPLQTLPETLKSLMVFNPMAGLVAASQDILLRAAWPHWGALIYPALLAGVLAALGGLLFRRHASEIVDQL